MVPAVPAVVPAALPGTCPRQIFFNGNTCQRYRRACGTGRVELSSTFQELSRQPRYRRQMKHLMETLIPGTADQLQASYLYADYNVTSNSQPNACKMAPFVNKDLCRGGGLILSFSNGERERKRARYQQRNLIDCIQNYTCTFHFIRNKRQTAVMSILKLTIRT